MTAHDERPIRIDLIVLIRVFVVALVFIFSACGTTQNHRSRQYSKEFAAIDPETRSLIEGGKIRLGMSPEAVYIALGAPLHMGRRMVMPAIPTKNLHRWAYRGNLRHESGAADSGEVLFHSQYASVTQFAAQAQRLIVDFEERRVSKIWLTDSESHILAIWE